MNTRMLVIASMAVTCLACSGKSGEPAGGGEGAAKATTPEAAGSAAKPATEADEKRAAAVEEGEKAAAETAAAPAGAADEAAKTAAADTVAAEGEAEAPAAAAAASRHPALLDPSKAQEKAPDQFAVKFETTKGEMIIDVHRDWAPNGADRFYNLVKIGYYDGTAFFRVIDGFMAQVGIHGDPKVNAVWRQARISDDPVKQSNTPGMVTFATAGPNTRTTQIFLNLGDNAQLDGMGFAPFGKLRDMTTLKKIYSGYGEGAPRGRGPAQGRIQMEGNAYLTREFPKLDYIVRATIIEEKQAKNE